MIALAAHYISSVQNADYLFETKVIIEKSRGEGSLMERDTIKNVS